MGGADQYLVFSLDGQSFALRLSAVERVMRAAEVTPLPGAPEVVIGVINVRGQVLPVFDTRRRLRMPAREIDPGDQLVVARARSRAVALLVDAVGDIHEAAGREVVAAGELLPGAGYIEGVVKLADGLLLIHDLDKFLSPSEEERLDAALVNS